jgi:tRNA nucleotidyltransferase (CCA-adding enzyme)
VAALAAHATTLRAAVREAIAAPALPPDATLRRWAAEAGRTRVADTLRVVLASLAAEATHGARDGDEEPWGEGEVVALRAAAPARSRALYRRASRVAYRDPVEVADLAVDGEDLMREGGVARGPSLGTVLRRLRDAVVDDPARNDRATLLTLARTWSAAEGGA